MDPRDETAACFAIPDLWASPTYAEEYREDATLFRPLDFNLPAIKLDNPYAPTKELEDALALPDLDTFEYGPLEDLETLAESGLSSDVEQLVSVADEQEDIWKIAVDLGPADHDVRFHSWEAFLDPNHQEPCSAYLSEAGPAVFDAALQLQAQRDSNIPGGRVLRSDMLLSSLLHLGMGRSSILFRYDGERKTFTQAINDGRMSGYSTLAAQGLIQRFIDGGNAVKYLRDFVNKTYMSQRSLPTSIALADAVSTVVSALEKKLSSESAAVRSLLQLQHLFDRPQQVLSRIRDTVSVVKSARSDGGLASRAFETIQHSEHENDWMRPILFHVFARVCRPWLETVSEWTGLQQEGGLSFSHGQSRSFADIEEVEEQRKRMIPNPSSYSFEADLVPTFALEEEAKLILETGKNLRILRAHRPEHPLSETEAWGIKAPQLEWKFDWAHMECVVEKANTYEKSLVAAIKQRGKHGKKETRLTSETQTCAADDAENLVWADDNVQKRYVEDLATEFDRSPLSSRTLPDELHDIVLLSLSSNPSPGTTTFAPPFSLVSALSFNPILHTQARLLNAALLRHFFQSCNFRHHLELQHRYHLFGDGVFATRLSNALFSPDLETAERHRGILRTGGSMGLRLGARQTWPPASSELRLALMGIIGDTYFASTRHDYNEDQSDRNRELPGGLSFSIRELSDAEIEKIMDPDGLHALDFLRLQYAPPKPLDAIITPASLQKYDTIFRFLLRLLRVHFVTTHLVRPHPLRGTHRTRTRHPNTSPTTTRFTLEAHHVVSALLAHFSTSGVTEPWTALSARLDAIERRLAHEDEAGQYGTRVTEGPDALGALHAAMLDTVFGALLLRGRQARARDALEALLDCVLAFAKSSQRQEHGDGRTVQQSGADADIEAGALYKSFRAKLSLFVDTCKELGEKKGRGAADPTSLAGTARAKVGGEGGTIERLILALEMSEYYGLPVT